MIDLANIADRPALRKLYLLLCAQHTAMTDYHFIYRSCDLANFYGIGAVDYAAYELAASNLKATYQAAAADVLNYWRKGIVAGETVMTVHNGLCRNVTVRSVIVPETIKDGDLPLDIEYTTGEFIGRSKTRLWTYCHNAIEMFPAMLSPTEIL